MRAPICERLDIEFPILVFSHHRDVVTGVSRAGPSTGCSTTC